LKIFVDGVEALAAVGEVECRREVEEALGVGEAAAAAVEQAVHQLALLLTDDSFRRILKTK
jgi:hypothetical protein